MAAVVRSKTGTSQVLALASGSFPVANVGGRLFPSQQRDSEKSICFYVGGLMEWWKVTVSAVIYLLPEQEGGKENPVTTGYSPNHNFIGPGNRNVCMGRIRIENDEWIYPGHERKVQIDFMLIKEYATYLKSGFAWGIQEGGRYVGNGRVIEVISESQIL